MCGDNPSQVTSRYLVSCTRTFSRQSVNTKLDAVTCVNERMDGAADEPVEHASVAAEDVFLNRRG